MSEAEGTRLHRDDSPQRRGRAFEERVVEVLRLSGYQVDTNVLVGGDQTDFVAFQPHRIRPSWLVGECKATAKPAGNQEVRDLHARVEAFRTEHKESSGLLVAAGFSKEAKATAAKLRLSSESCSRPTTSC